MTGTLILSGATPLQVTTTTPGSGKVLVSDSSGNVSWGSAGSVSAPLALSSNQSASSILSVTNLASAPSVAAFRVFSQASGDRAIGVEVTGDTNRRLAIDSTGKLAWGPGNAGQDVNWYRLASGVVGTDNAIQSPTVQGSSSASGTLTLSSTSNATKGKLLVGTSAYDEVNNRLGIGNASPAYPLDVSGVANLSQGLHVGVATYTSSHTLDATNNLVLASAASGAVTITLPTASGITGRTYTIKRTDATYANAVTVATTSSQTIDGTTTYTQLWVQYAFVQVVSDGSNWQIVDASTIPEPWQAMSLQNSWSNQGGTNVTAQYRRTAFKRVEVVGLISHASISGSSTIATLASPYLAAHDQTIGGIAAVANGYITVVASTGALTLNNLSSNTAVGFNGSYSLDA